MDEHQQAQSLTQAQAWGNAMLRYGRDISRGKNKELPASAVLKNVKAAFLNEEYSDLTLICGDKTFPAHKVMICARSDWFKIACDGRFKESSGEIHLDEKEPVLIERLLEYFYTGEYSAVDVAIEAYPLDDEGTPTTPKTRKRKRESYQIVITKHQKISSGGVKTAGEKTMSEEQSDSCLSPKNCPEGYFHARMFAEADYFMMDDLQLQAAENFSCSLRACSSKWELEIIITELWSGRANYKVLQDCFMRHLTAMGSIIARLFLGLTPEFFASVPDFAVDFASEWVMSRLNFEW